MAGQGDRTAERAVAALNPVGLLPVRIARGVPLALDRQQAVLEGDLHVAGLDTRELGRYQVGVFSFADVDRWCPAGGAGTALVPLARPPGPSGSGTGTARATDTRRSPAGAARTGPA